MKYFVFSDVHGCAKELKEALLNAGYDECNSNHMLLFLGDAFGHNKYGHYEVYKFLCESLKNNKLKWILGNHEIYLLNALAKEEASKFTIDTIRDIAIGLDTNAIDYTDKECIRVLKANNVDKMIKENGINYFETDNYVLTHGFIPYNKSMGKYDQNWRNVSPKKWNYFRCLNGQKLVNLGIKIPNKKLVCGHVGAYFGYIIKNYPNVEIDSKEFNNLAHKLMKGASVNKEPFNIYYGNNVIGVDGRAYDTHNVNVFVFEE